MKIYFEDARGKDFCCVEMQTCPRIGERVRFFGREADRRVDMVRYVVAPDSDVHESIAVTLGEESATPEAN